MTDMRERNYGFLTPLMREHLLMRNDEEPTYNNEEEREKARGKRKQNDHQIPLHAKQSLKDLALVSMAYTEKRNRDIFSIEDMRILLSAVILKNGRDTTDIGPYYLVLINTIIDTLNHDHDGRHTQLKYQIVEDMWGIGPLPKNDLTNRRIRLDYHDNPSRK